MTIDDFFRAIDTDNLRAIDRALALLWFIGREDASLAASTKSLCEIIERHGHPKQNASRLNEALAEDRRTSKAGPDSWRLLPRARRIFDEQYSAKVYSRAARASDTVLSRDLFKLSRRGYLDKVVYQLNASYDHGLYDCCAVMCRRVLETLLIEVYEAKGRTAEIKAQMAIFSCSRGCSPSWRRMLT
jgi:hypothetical protein